MTYATVRAAAEHLARVGSITPHQLAALTALDQSLSDEQRQGFTELWRAAGSPAAAGPDAWMAPALKIIREDFAYIPLHLEPQVFGVRDTVADYTLRAQEDVDLRGVKMR